MANSYIPVARNQPRLLPLDMCDWLPDVHLVWFVLDVVAQVDTSPLHARHPNAGQGRRAYDPDMLLALLLYAYCTGVRSSRQIERRCEIDVAYRVICDSHVPDHTTIARFRQVHTKEVERLFIDVLALCAAAGLVRVGVVAVDGTKVAANAAGAANRTLESIEAEVRAMLDDAEARDAEEDELFGDARGDELPADLADPNTRRDRLNAAAARLRAEQAEREAEAAAPVDAWRREQEAAAAEGRRPRRRPPEDAAVAAAEAAVRMEDERTEATHRAYAARTAAAKARGRKPNGAKPAEVTAAQRRARRNLERAKARAAARREKSERLQADAAARKAKANTTDPDSRVMKTPSGWVQGYNAQAGVNERGVVITASVTNQCNDMKQCEPMMRAVVDNLDAVGASGAADLLLFDAGYLTLDNLVASGPERLIATRRARRLRAPASTRGDPPPDARPIAAMEHRLATPSGRSTYKLRGQLVEPFFGTVKDARGVRRFMRRGLGNVDAEWKFVATAHNILKLFGARMAAAG